MTRPSMPFLAQAVSLVSDARGTRLASLAHLGGILLFPPALLIWLLSRDRAPFAEEEAKEALNWQITVALMLVVVDTLAGVLWLALFFTPLDAVGRAADVLPWLVYAVNVVLSVIGFLATRAGRGYRYPIALRFVK